MAKATVKSEINLDLKITLELTLQEARALNEITKYGHKPFLEGYYKQLGRSYLKPHENGVISLFDTIDKSLPRELYKANEIIEAINKVVNKTN